MTKTKTLIILCLLCIHIETFAQLKVGDPGVTFNQSVINANQGCYPQMQRWSEAGVIGGIPFISSFDSTATINPGNSSTINTAITNMANSLSGNERGVITLTNGTYTINSRINMRSNVSLRGVSRDGVRCRITMTSQDAFYFNNISYAGLYNLTIEGSWGTPTYNWNYGISANNELPNNENISIKMRGTTENCWLDKVTILNCARDPLRVNAKHNTLRDLYVDGAHKKAGGAQGYFFIQNSDNLVTGCYVTHLRHITLQGGNVEYNVVYDNNFDQEVSFHNGDNGNNLIINNNITLPVDMPPVAPGDADATTPVEARNNKPTYFAIMGPWSNQHTASANPNFLINNNCLQLNHNFGSQTPWSQPNVVYTGPLEVGNNTTEHINNFPLVSGACQSPSGNTLYPIQLGTAPPAQYAFGGINATIPGTIQTENYDLGGQGVAYNDSNTNNVGGQYRSDGVDIQNTGDTGGGHNVGWVNNGEWLEYTVNASAGNYTIEARLASGNANPGDLQIELAGTNLGTFNPQNTGGWQSYTTYTLNNISISGGNDQVLRITAVNGGSFNMNWIRFVQNTPAQYAFGGTNATIPGTIQAENYDVGGQGIAYNDTNTNNAGGQYRNDGVDIQNTSDTGGGHNVGWVNNGEWLEYTVNASAGTYTVEARLASANGNPGDLQVQLAGTNLGTFSPQNTGGWQSYVTYTLNTISISGGNNQVLRLTAVNGGSFNMNWIRFTNTNSAKTDSSHLKNDAAHNIQLYPVPVNNALILKFNSSIYTKVSVSDIAGKVIATKTLTDAKTQTIDVSFLKSGTYFLSFTNNTSSVTKQFIKE